ncbi:MAG: hypothetical protein R3F05_02055 [Planctomycetota bacterium]
MTAQPILLDDESTWPHAIVEALAQGFRELEQFEEARAEIDARAERDVLLRVRRPPNPYSSRRSEVLERIRAVVHGSSFVGYHCTRLHPSEADDVLKSGLRPLDPAFTRDRIQRLADSCDLPASIATKLQRHNRSDDAKLAETRTGMIWFILSRSLLQAETGVGRFFAYWGGEAIYADHEEDAEIARYIQGVGEPCIVIAALGSTLLHTYIELSELMMLGYLERRGVAVEHDTRAGRGTRTCDVVGRREGEANASGTLFGDHGKLCEYSDALFRGHRADELIHNEIALRVNQQVMTQSSGESPSPT